jgi:hypothetical protein
MADIDLDAAHKASIYHRLSVLASARAGCFYCLAVFEPSEIAEWCDAGATALCPRCHIDSVIPSGAGYALDERFLRAMHERWFARTVPLETLEEFAPAGPRPQLFAQGRVRVDHVLGLLEAGRSVDEICEDFPDLDRRDVEEVALTGRLTRHDRT